MRPLEIKNKNTVITDEKNYIFVQEFNLSSMIKFHDKFRTLIEDPIIKVVPILIASYGGGVHALLGMLDIIAMSPKPVATIAIGCAMSCGSVLLSAGTKGYRYATSNTDIMIHEVSSGEHGKITEMEAGIVETKKLNTKLMTQLAINCGKKDTKFIIKEMKKRTNLDWYLTAESAKTLGLIDHVGLPAFIQEK